MESGSGGSAAALAMESGGSSESTDSDAAPAMGSGESEAALAMGSGGSTASTDSEAAPAMGSGGSAAALAMGSGGSTAAGRAEAKTSVWWDIDEWPLPKACDPHRIAQNISSALAEMGYTGAVAVSAYGDTSILPSSVQHALNASGISLIHVPAGDKNARDMKIIGAIFFWALDNPPPANYLLISGDRDFGYSLDLLRKRGYNILLAKPLQTGISDRI